MSPALVLWASHAEGFQERPGSDRQTDLRRLSRSEGPSSEEPTNGLESDGVLACDCLLRFPLY